MRHVYFCLTLMLYIMSVVMAQTYPTRFMDNRHQRTYSLNGDLFLGKSMGDGSVSSILVLPKGYHYVLLGIDIDTQYAYVARMGKWNTILKINLGHSDSTPYLAGSLTLQPPDTGKFYYAFNAPQTLVNLAFPKTGRVVKISLGYDGSNPRESCEAVVPLSAGRINSVTTDASGVATVSVGRNRVVIRVK